MTKTTSQLIVVGLVLLGVGILGFDTYLKATDAIEAKIHRAEKAYAQGNFEHYKAKDPQDKSSEALYWYIQTLD
jgi:hypothetical protein